MTITWKWVKWEFNSASWSQAMSVAIEQYGLDDLSELTGLSKSCIKGWSNGTYTKGFEHPHLSNFLIVCNLLDLNPVEFFTTSLDD